MKSFEYVPLPEFFLPKRKPTKVLFRRYSRSFSISGPALASKYFRVFQTKRLAYSRNFCFKNWEINALHRMNLKIKN